MRDLHNISGLAAKYAEKNNFGSVFPRNNGFFAAKVELFRTHHHYNAFAMIFSI